VRIDLEIGFSFKRELEDGYRSLELPDASTILNAFELLGARYDIFRKRVFDGAGGIRRNINALVNGGNVQLREGFDTILQEGDRLTVLPPVGGG
jgi:molybdopterin synthase sulfur carrier subunit